MAFHVFQGTGLDIYLKGWSGSEERSVSVDELRNHTARSIHPSIFGSLALRQRLFVCVQAAGLVLASFQQEQNRPVDQLQNRYQGIWQLLLTTVREEEGVPVAGRQREEGSDRESHDELGLEHTSWAQPSRKKGGLGSDSDGGWRSLTFSAVMFLSVQPWLTELQNTCTVRCTTAVSTAFPFFSKKKSRNNVTDCSPPQAVIWKTTTCMNEGFTLFLRSSE